MICKISGNCNRRVSFFGRFMLHLFMNGNYEELITKNEANFFQKFMPMLEEDSKLRTPKSYFVGKNTEMFTV